MDTILIFVALFFLGLLVLANLMITLKDLVQLLLYETPPQPSQDHAERTPDAIRVGRDGNGAGAEPGQLP